MFFTVTTGKSALIPVLLHTQYSQDPAFRDTATVFTIHNMGYQGLFPAEILPLLTLPWDLFTITKMEFFGQVNFLKGALAFSDYVTTVSRKIQPGDSDHRIRVSAWKACCATVPPRSPAS